MRILPGALIAVTLFATPAFAQQAPPAAAESARPARGASHHVILCGSGGEAEYSPIFREWGTRLKNVLALRLGAAPENIAILMEPETASAPAGTSISLETIQALFKGLAHSVTPEDDVFIYLIGHGSYLKNASKFEIPGPDLSADAFEAMLAELPAKHIVVIDGT